MGMIPENLEWHHIHWEYTIGAVVIGPVCTEGPGCSPDRSHIIVYPPPENVETSND